MKRLRWICILGLINCLNSPSVAEVVKPPLDPTCGNLSENTFHRPIDYHSSTPEFRGIIEGPHFPPFVENLQRGNTHPKPGHDISYTLRTFPNHSRALMAMVNLSRKEKTNKPVGSDYTVDCWIARALEFKPEDGQIRQVYSILLMRRGKYSNAVDQLLLAEEYLGSSGNILYNLGLAYFELGDYEKAVSYAHKAYARGFTLLGLKKKLIAKGRWQEPSATPQEASNISDTDIKPISNQNND